MHKTVMSTLRGAHSLKYCILLFMVILGGYYYYVNRYVVFNITDHDSGRVLFQKRLGVDESFTLHYIHSVTNQPVDEIFYIKDKYTLALREMRYDSFGANLPVGPEQLKNETTQFHKRDGYYQILYENRSFDVVPLRVGQVVANHKLFFEDGSKVRFLDIAKGGAYVEYFVSPVLSLAR